MNHNSQHHWSFDYNYGAQNPQFKQELIQTLDGCYKDTDARDTRTRQAITHIYNILPNYWRGYAGGDAKETLSIGTVIVERNKQDGLWNYSVQYENTTSGENLRMQFRCSDEHYRPLADSWRVDVRNSGNDEYSELMCEGYLAVDSEVRLRINGAEIIAGTVDTSAKLTCNWALFDVIPALAKTIRASGNVIELALLEDLEQLRVKSRLGFLESIQTPFPLDGYYLYGAGLLPAYWWLDADRNIAIASTFFETLVLREKIGGNT
ncbi:hypothetical protein F4Z99_17005 [Candidatus Poribacteria bacterium]|nr:hypothetical protein [Candidatus Poribacteria bacterium]MYA99235.1 hypothetical protein [Candidatus Poribacteria bacterium]